ncbi:MAG: sensor histidine kinase [Azospirillaceae bacterium]|nr:sensor histidine kinase [Azospirillaceae bacterium]
MSLRPPKLHATAAQGAGVVVLLLAVATSAALSTHALERLYRYRMSEAGQTAASLSWVAAERLGRLRIGSDRDAGAGDPDTLLHILDSVIDDGGALTAVGIELLVAQPDGQVLARSPSGRGTTSPLLRLAADGALRDAMAGTRESSPPNRSATEDGTIPLAEDGSLLAVARRPVPGLPLQIVARVTRDRGLAAWHDAIATILAANGIPLVILAGLGAARRHQNRRRKAARPPAPDRAGSELTAALERAVVTRDLRLQEMSHRIKNNLQIVSSILMLQSQEVTDPVARSHLDDMAARVQRFASLHDMLSQEAGSGLIDARPYLTDFCRDVAASMATHARVQIQTRIAATPLPLSARQIMPVAMIIHELVTNSLKYAFADDRGGTITISVAAGPANGLTVVVADDGEGLRGAPQAGPTPGLGLRLVQALAEQIGATVALNGPDLVGPGMRWTLTVPAMLHDRS